VGEVGGGEVCGVGVGGEGLDLQGVAVFFWLVNRVGEGGVED